MSSKQRDIFVQKMIALSHDAIEPLIYPAIHLLEISNTRVEV
jgi:hypothetical protein